MGEIMTRAGFERVIGREKGRGGRHLESGEKQAESQTGQPKAGRQRPGRLGDLQWARVRFSGKRVEDSEWLQRE